MPAIAYVKGNHFLVFEEVVSDGVLISDPADKYDRYLSFKELSEIWNGELLTFDYQPEQAEQNPVSHLFWLKQGSMTSGKYLAVAKSNTLSNSKT